MISMKCILCELPEESLDTSLNDTFTTKCGHTICFDHFDDYILNIKQYPTPCFCCTEKLDDDEVEKNLWDDFLFNFQETRSHFMCQKYPNLYPCRNPYCTGIYDHKSDQVLISYICSLCGQKSCNDCQAIHDETETCEDWRSQHTDIIASKRKMDKENKRQKKAGLSMECVRCKTMIQKLVGCDGVRCPVCTIGLCFKTKQARWGPNGKDDISGGCRCMWDGTYKTLCHPRCKGCFVHEPVDTMKEEIYLRSINSAITTIQNSGQSILGTQLFQL